MMRRLVAVLVLVLALSSIAAGVAWAAGEDAAQEDPPPDESQQEATGLALLLAPLVAAATAIERIIEMGFDWFEGAVHNLGGFLGIGGEYLKKAQDEIKLQRQAVQDLLKKTAEERAQDTNFEVKLGRAEDALADAKERLVDFFKSPGYTSLKRAIALIAGLILGPILTFSMQLGMFDLLGISLTPWLDHLVTGLIIGTGSAPVHSLIGLLQKTRDAVDEARGLWSARRFQAAITGAVPAGAAPAMPARDMGPALAPDAGAPAADAPPVAYQAPAMSEAELRRLVSRRTR
jgi:hypothetical protein